MTLCAEATVRVVVRPLAHGEVSAQQRGKEIRFRLFCMAFFRRSAVFTWNMEPWPLNSCKSRDCAEGFNDAQLASPKITVPPVMCRFATFRVQTLTPGKRRFFGLATSID